MRLIDADAIQYDQLLKTGNKEHPLEWAVSQSSINSIPTIKALSFAERHGRWINDNHLIKCSICRGPIPLNKVVLHGEIIWEDNRPVNYCPHCGAKMDEERENESC